MTHTTINGQQAKISVVTPTLRRPKEVSELLRNLSEQTLLPFEIIIVDGAPPEEKETERIVDAISQGLPFCCKYLRHGGGTAIQRNVGIDHATGDFIAFIDDDIRLEPDFFHEMINAFEKDADGRVGGIAGYITNQHFDMNTSARWQWYKRLHLFTIYEPGRYDYYTGYPINRYMQPPHNSLRGIDFMGSNCGVWRRQVFEGGLRFSEFFIGYGVLEDTHFALRAKRSWRLLENGAARCVHLHVGSGRENSRSVMAKTAINYRFVFMDIVPKRDWKQEFAFWRVQLFDLFRLLMYAVRHYRADNWLAVLGKCEGILRAWRLQPESRVANLPIS